jgi:hypothetical protein
LPYEHDGYNGFDAIYQLGQDVNRTRLKQDAPWSSWLHVGILLNVAL